MAGGAWTDTGWGRQHFLAIEKENNVDNPHRHRTFGPGGYWIWVDIVNTGILWKLGYCGHWDIMDFRSWDTVDTVGYKYI